MTETPQPRWREFTVKELQQVHCDYQRPLDKKRSQKYADEYDPNLQRPPVVSVRDNGTVAVVDGQHTVEMLRIMFGLGHRVNCECLYGLVYEQEAKTFYRLNYDRKPPDALDRHRALLESKDPEARIIQDVITQAGFTVPHGTGGGHEWNKINGIGTVYRIVRLKGPGRLAETLKIIAELYENDRHATNSAFMWTIAAIQDARDMGGREIDRKRLMRVLGDSKPSRFLRKGDEGGGASARCYSAIVSAYNYRLQRPDRRMQPGIPTGWYGK